jgi:hypothetical protein
MVKKIILLSSLPILFVLLVFCSQSKQVHQKPIKVEVRQVEGMFRLYRDGQPFYIKGAGGSSRIAELAAHGGNSIRTWSTRNAQAVLDSAQKHGITVLMGLHVQKERHGFDYNDEQAVRDQLEQLTAEVKQFKDHPALLAWGIGNELNLHYTNKKVWDAVNDIAAMIHEVDGLHPVTTMLAGVHKEEVDYIKQHCQHLDFLSVQMYADVINVKKRVEEAGWEGPYAVTEWGATGHWEVPVTPWGAAIEQTSSERARLLKERYEQGILLDSAQCLGSYVFLWGQKQERTPTWYGLFLETDEKTESMDVLHYLWKGSWPENRAPQIFDVLLQGKTRFDNIRLNAGQLVSLTFRSYDFEEDSLRIEAQVLPESTELGEGGDYEPRPPILEGLIEKTGASEVIFKTPQQAGAYRIFVYIFDDYNHAATANVPFYVQ